MTVAERLFMPGEQRGSVNTAHPKDPALAAIFGFGAQTTAGVDVTHERSLGITSVYAAIRILAESLASLPLVLYERDGDSKQRAENRALYRILHDQPNRWQTSFEWREMMAGHVLLRGNAYSFIASTGASAVDELIPLHPDRMRPFWAPSGRPAYEYHKPDGGSVVYLDSEIHHLRGPLSDDGLTGRDPIDLHAESLGLSIAADRFGASFFGNGTNPAGVLQHPNNLSPEAYERLRSSWEKRHQGVESAHKPAILEEGMTWQSISIEPEKAQFLESRKFQVAEVSRIFRVPLHMLSELSGATFSNIEQQALEFVIHSLRPWLVRWEQAIGRDLVVQPRRFFAKFLVEGLLRGDSEARGKFYNTMFQIGVYSPNDIREKEDENPVEGGDQRFVPLNMLPLEQAPEAQEGDNQRELHQRTIASYGLIFRQAMDKVVTAEVRKLRTQLDQADDMGDFRQRAADFYADHVRFVRRHLQPAMEAMAVALGGELDENHVRERAQNLVTDRANELEGAIRGGAEAVRGLLDEWDDGRAVELAEAEIQDTVERVSHAPAST